jgi:hypothetical protein
MAQSTDDYVAALRTKWRLRVPAIEALSTTFKLKLPALEDLSKKGSLPDSFLLWQKGGSDTIDPEDHNQFKDFTDTELQSAWDMVWQAEPLDGHCVLTFFATEQKRNFNSNFVKASFYHARNSG